MKVVIQRVSSASVETEKKIVSQIELGLLVLVGMSENDTDADVEWCAKKVIELRIFEDSNNKMNLSVTDIKGSILAVSQFTLLANCKKGRRPSFTNAMKPDLADKYINKFIKYINDKGINCLSGVFGANMKVSLTNEGPVTIILNSNERPGK